MPRPRFERLPPERREAILDAAAAELSEHGFAGASYNRIIESAGLSKGAMYYYFADKQDLFATVLRDAMEGLFAAIEPMGPVEDAAAFWAEVERMAGDTWAHAMSTPRVAALLPVLLDAGGQVPIAEALAEVYGRGAEWMTSVLRRGREVRAVRDDLPDDLLLAVTMAVGEAIDRWVAQRWLAAREQGGGGPPEGPLMATLIDLLRRVAAP